MWWGGGGGAEVCLERITPVVERLQLFVLDFDIHCRWLYSV